MSRKSTIFLQAITISEQDFSAFILNENIEKSQTFVPTQRGGNGEISSQTEKLKRGE